MSAPFARRAAPVPVTVIAAGAELPRIDDSVALVELEPPLHDHGGGAACIACESRGDVRVLLFELDEKLRRGLVAPFSAVVVDARAVADPQAVRDALVPGRLPALGLRDHAIARNFRLAD